ncbi:MAG: ATP-binding protein [Burkholderiaceae bacterium]
MAAALKRLRRSLRGGDERLQTLAAELERLAISLPGTTGVDNQPAEFAPEPADDPAGLAGGETARFDPLEIERFGSLQSVARRVSEAAADNRQLDQAIAAHLDQLDGQLARLEEIDNTLRETSLRARMVPAGQLATRLQRVCRQAGRAVGRELQLVLDGDDTLVDADLLQALAEPLGHLVRNAVGHGIEDREERLAAGKPLDGRLVVAFAAVPGGLSVRVEDDGRGLDLAGVARRARALGLLAQDLDIDFQAAAQLVLAPGFSTRERASQLSGRGMGLDVVNQVVRGLRGSISLTGTPGQGLAVCIDLPREMSLRNLFIVAAPTHVLALSTRGSRRSCRRPTRWRRTSTAPGCVWGNAGWTCTRSRRRFACRPRSLPRA